MKKSVISIFLTERPPFAASLIQVYSYRIEGVMIRNKSIANMKIFLKSGHGRSR